jgi:hypothetical protein
MDQPAEAPSDPDEVLRQMFRERQYPDLDVHQLDRNIDDIPVIHAAGHDMRTMFAREFIRLLAAKIDAPRRAGRTPTCQMAAYLMTTATYWRTLSHLLNTDDSIWKMLFARDFVQFGERAHDWTRNRPMPWKSAYLWTVFFRRRCLRSLLLDIPGQPDFRMIKFGRPGSVCAVEEWVVPDRTGPPSVLYGYWAVHMSRVEFYPVDQTGGFQLLSSLLEGRSAHTEDQGRAYLSNLPIVSFPGDALMTSMVRISQREYMADMRKPPRPLRDIFASVLVPKRQLAWDYSDALYAYCSFGRARPHGASAPILEEDQAIFDLLPHYPHARDRKGEEKLYLGAHAQ